MPSTTKYIKATAAIYFPEDEVSCNSCPLMGAEVLSARRYCRRSGELLHHTEHQIGFDCPLKFETMEENNGIQNTDSTGD